MTDNLPNVIPVAAKRHTADERREDVLQAAISEFAASGLHGTSTDAIARRAGISQPYLFRLFGTKRDLFLDVVKLGSRRILDAFQQAAVGKGPEEIFDAMGQAYVQLLVKDRELLLVQLHAHAASDDPEVRDAVRNCFRDLVTYVERVSARGEDEVRAFFATGMLLNVMAAIDLGAVDEPWAAHLLGPCKDLL